MDAPLPSGPLIDAGPAGLAALEARLARDLAILNQPAANWITPQTDAELGPVLDVAIIGAGMAGLALAFALIRDGVRNIALYDANPPGQEGPWVTYARMETLRSPKQLVGPALGMPALTFRAWFEAQFGPADWDELWRIPRTQWMDYLRWYRTVLDLPVENGAQVIRLEPHGNRLALCFADGRRIAARRAVLATGRDGLGGPTIPALYAALPPDLCAHSSAPIDFAALRGKRVAVIGAGASGFDNAGSALEAGAAEVHMLMRRAEVPRVNKGMGVSSPGMNAGYHDLPPARRLAITAYLNQTGTPPPRLSVLRCTRHANFRWRPSTPVLAATADAGQLRLRTPQGTEPFDFVIPATGFGIDLPRRPELAHLAADMLRWRDACPEVAGMGPDYEDSPFLGPHMEFLPRPGGPDWVRRVACLNFAATLSHYKLSGDIPAISAGAARLADGLVRGFFTEDYEDHWQRLHDYTTPELRGDEW